MVLVSVGIGILGGLGAVGFRASIRFFQNIFWHSTNPTLAYLHALPWWWRVVGPASGGLVVGLIIAHFAAEASDAEMADFVRLVGRIAADLGVAPGVGGGGFRLISNAGEDAIQEVPHMHVHILAGRPLGRILSASG